MCTMWFGSGRDRAGRGVGRPPRWWLFLGGWFWTWAWGALSISVLYWMPYIQAVVWSLVSCFFDIFHNSWVQYTIEKKEPKRFAQPSTKGSVVEGCANLFDSFFWGVLFLSLIMCKCLQVGDGGEGGGVVLGDSSWGPKVLNLANDVLVLFNGDLAIFAFKVYEESDLIRLRLDKLSDKYVNHDFLMCLHYTLSMVFIGHLSFVNLIVYGC